MGNNSIIVIAAIFSYLLTGCSTSEEVSFDTQICLTTKHHGLIIAETQIYVKWNSELFPGYNPEVGYDTSYFANSAGRLCISDVPFGVHWFLGFGVDHQIQEPVWGLLQLEVTLKEFRIDTVMDVSE